MQRKYTDRLIKRCQRVMSKRAGFDITEDQALMYLDQFAKVGNLALKLLELHKQKNNRQ